MADIANDPNQLAGVRRLRFMPAMRFFGMAEHDLAC
jgi:hypothetical protein